MRFSKKLLCTAALSAILPFQAFAVPSSESVSVNATATVVAPVLVEQTQAMAFGNIAKIGSGGGTVTTASGGTGSAGADFAGTPAATTAQFGVTGTASTAYTVTSPSTVTLSETGGDEMTLTLSFASGSASRTTDGSGDDSFELAGSLAVNGDQAVGSYTGSYTVSVAY